MDPVGDFLATKTVRRAIALGTFIGLAVLLRDMAPLLVFFLAFCWGFGAGAGLLARHLRLPRTAALLGLVGLFLGLLGGAVYLGVTRGLHAVALLRETLPARIALIRDTALYQRVEEHLPEAGKYLEGASHYATSAVGYVTGFGRLLLAATIGLILAVLYLLEEEELATWARTIGRTSLTGTLLRWAGYAADAVTVTVQLQVIVASLNALFTLPILLALGIPHPGPLLLMIFVSSLVPVVGNLVAGAVLTLLAFNARGLVGVGVFVGLTFVLHKVESYYLNPRLTARHIRLPSMVLIASLVLWEHLLGIAGLFVSFPFLFVANRIRDELRQEDRSEAESAAETETETETAKEPEHEETEAETATETETETETEAEAEAEAEKETETETETEAETEAEKETETED